MFENSKTQKQQVLDHLKKYGYITTMTAFNKYKITRLSQYIMLLRRAGHQIKSLPIRETHKRPYVKYVYG